MKNAIFIGSVVTTLILGVLANDQNTWEREAGQKLRLSCYPSDIASAFISLKEEKDSSFSRLVYPLYEPMYVPDKVIDGIIGTYYIVSRIKEQPLRTDSLNYFRSSADIIVNKLISIYESKTGSLIGKPEKYEQNLIKYTKLFLESVRNNYVNIAKFEFDNEKSFCPTALLYLNSIFADYVRDTHIQNLEIRKMWMEELERIHHKYQSRTRIKNNFDSWLQIEEYQRARITMNIILAHYR